MADTNELRLAIAEAIELGGDACDTLTQIETGNSAASPKRRSIWRYIASPKPGVQGRQYESACRELDAYTAAANAINTLLVPHGTEIDTMADASKRVWDSSAEVVPVLNQLIAALADLGQVRVNLILKRQLGPLGAAPGDGCMTLAQSIPPHD